MTISNPIWVTKAHPVVPGSSISRAGGRIPKTGFSFQFFGCPELFVRMPVAVLQPFSSCGTVDTPITASHSMPSRARRRRPPHRIPSYHILGYLGQRDEPRAHGFGQLMRQARTAEMRPYAGKAARFNVSAQLVGRFSTASFSTRRSVIVD